MTPELLEEFRGTVATADPIFQETTRPNDKRSPAKAAGVQPSERVPVEGTQWGKALLNLFGEVDGKPRFQTWPERLVKELVNDTYDAVKFSGDVLQGKADPRDPANFKHVMNLALMAVTVGWKPVKAAYPGITDEHIKALDAYTGSAYHQLNRYLEGRLHYTPSKEQQKFLNETADRLDALIKNSPKADKDLEVWRGIPGESFVARYPNLNPGDVIKFDAYTSTSRSKGTAWGFAGDRETGIVFQIKTPKGTPVLDVEATANRFGGSALPESEILLPRGLQYVVKNLDKDNRVITLEVVPPGKKVKGELVEARPPKPQEPQTPYMQDVTKLLKDLEKSPSYIKQPTDPFVAQIHKDYSKAVSQDGWTGTFNEWLQGTGNYNKFYGTKASPVSATPTLETLQKQKDELYAAVNKLPPGTNKWFKEVEKFDAIDAQIKALKLKGKKEFGKLLSEGNAL